MAVGEVMDSYSKQFTKLIENIFQSFEMKIPSKSVFRNRASKDRRILMLYESYE